MLRYLAKSNPSKFFAFLNQHLASENLLREPANLPHDNLIDILMIHSEVNFPT